jgi:deoxycytidine triphosphate deaminase
MILEGKAVLSALSNLKDPGVQLSVNGVDLTVASIGKFTDEPAIDFDNSKRKKSGIYWMKKKRRSLNNKEMSWFLQPGAYQIRYNEKVKIPVECSGYVFPRSTLMANGAMLFSALWDSGYEGQGRGLLVVFNHHGMEIFENARVGQMVFIRAENPENKKYDGVYQGEKAPST